MDRPEPKVPGSKTGGTVVANLPVQLTGPLADVMKSSLTSNLLREAGSRCHSSFRQFLGYLEVSCDLERLHWVLLGSLPTGIAPAKLEADFRAWGPGDALHGALGVVRPRKGLDYRKKLTRRDEALERLEEAIDELLDLARPSGTPVISIGRIPEVRSQLEMARRIIDIFRGDILSSVRSTSGSLVKTPQGDLGVSLFEPAPPHVRGRPRESWKSEADRGLTKAGVNTRAERRFLISLIERRAKLTIALPLSSKEEPEAVAAELLVLVRARRRRIRRA